MRHTSDFYCDHVLSEKVQVRKVIETRKVLAFYHTRPSWTFHVVVIPKVHIKDLSELDDYELLVEIFKVIQEVVEKFKLNETNFKVVNNGGNFQDSKHLHFHILSGKPMKKYTQAAK